MKKVVANSITDNAERLPHHPALIDRGRTYPFLQHANRVCQRVDALEQAGCRRRDRIAVLSRNCAEYLEIYGACELGGCIAAPVNHRLAAAEINHIVGDTTAMFYSAEYLQLAHHLHGAASYIQQEFNPAVIWDTLQTEGITTLQLVPTMIEMLLADDYAVGRNPARVKTIFYSTAPIREALLRKARAVFGPVFIQQYGSTEGGSVSTLTKNQHQPDGTGEQQRRLLSAGQVCDGVEIKIVKPDGTVADTGETGEIVVRHPDIMLEYWNDPKVTAASIRDGWLGMGDIGYLDGQGFLQGVAVIRAARQGHAPDHKVTLVGGGNAHLHPDFIAPIPLLNSIQSLPLRL